MTDSNDQPITVGHLIDVLALVPQYAWLTIQGVSGAPFDVSSYRGYYDHLAIEYTADHRATVADFIRILRDAVGSTMEGYKGGDFTMTRQTPVWVSNWGTSSGVAVTGVALVEGDGVQITTAACENWCRGEDEAALHLARLGFPIHRATTGREGRGDA